MNKLEERAIVERYWDFYKDESEDGINFRLYDIKEVVHPSLILKVDYTKRVNKKLHQIELEFLNLIGVLASQHDGKETLQKVTQLDQDIFNSLLNNLELRGLINTDPLTLTKDGWELKRSHNLESLEEDVAFVKLDQLRGEIIEVSDYKFHAHTDNSDKTVELKPKLSFQPRKDTLDEVLQDHKTLRTTIMENLDSVWGILNIEIVGKSLDKRLCLFYECAEQEKILVLYSIKNMKNDEKLTGLLEKAIKQGKFEFNAKNKRYEQLITKHDEARSKSDLNFEEGCNILFYDFPRYLNHALATANSTVFVSSPWVREAALNKYKKQIESALNRKIKVYLGYGLKPRGINKQNKPIIDESCKTYLEDLESRFPNFKTCKMDSHAKVLICDSDWVIKGSFNWFSCSIVEGDEVGREEGLLSKNIQTIKDSKKSFGF